MVNTLICDPFTQVFLLALPVNAIRKWRGCQRCRVLCNHHWPMVKQNNGTIHEPDNSLHRQWFYNEESMLAKFISPTRPHESRLARERGKRWLLEAFRRRNITTEKGSNIVKAASLYNWTRLQCFGHRPHTSVKTKISILKKNEKSACSCQKAGSQYTPIVPRTKRKT